MSEEKTSEARLGDRILAALEMAIDQGDLKISETLLRAMELTMTRNINGEDFVERRDYPEGLEKALVKLEELRKKDAS